MEWKVAPSYQDWTIEQIDEVAKKALASTDCDKCGGSGNYAWFGTCFKCSGTGRIGKWVKIYTPEQYDKYIASQERTKERKREKEEARLQSLRDNSEANKAELLAKWGYDAENPKVYIIAGDNTYNIKDVIKERGGRYNPALNWFFTKETEVPEGYSLVAIDFDDVYDWLPMVKKFELKENAKEVVEQAKYDALPASKSDFIGSIKERLRNLKVTLTGARAVDSVYGTSILFTFKQGDNELVWFTSSPPDSDKAVVGSQYSLTGTVKDHKIYNGVKQTYLNRCILKEIAI